MSRIEQIEGARWARQTAEQIGLLANTCKGIEEVITVVRRGTVDKPADYAKGVQSVIDILEIGSGIKALKEKT